MATGIRQRSTLDAVKLNVGGLAVPVVYAGPQGQYARLDQVNAILPASFVGRGTVNVVLTVDGKQANAVSVTLP